MKKEIDDFAAGAPPFDDTTMLAIRMNKYMQKEGISVTPDLDSFPKVTAYIEEKMEESEISMKLSYKINVAVDEIYSNIAKYSSATWALIQCIIDNEAIRVTFWDNGIPYNPLKAKNPDVTLDLEEREIGGLGIFLTRKLMDEVTYKHENGCNHVEIVLRKIG